MSGAGLSGDTEFTRMAWVIGALAGIGIVLLVLLIRKLTGQSRNKFDERQIAARGVAYKCGFFTMMACEAAYSFLTTAGIRFADEMTGPLLGIFAGVAVFGVVAAVKDAYTALDETPRSRWLWPVLGLLWLLIGIAKLAGGEAVRDGVLTVDSLQFFLGLAFLAVGAADLIHSLKNRGTDGEGE